MSDIGLTDTKFIKIRRQDFMSLEYYEKVKDYCEEDIRKELADGYPRESTKYNSADVLKWSVIASNRFDLLFLAYTAGRPIEELGAMLESAIEAHEKKADYGRDYFDDPSFTTMGGEGDSFLLPLQYIGLAYLLHRRDLLPRISILAQGKDGKWRGNDDIYEKLYRFNDLTRKPEGYYINEDYIDLLNALYEGNSSEEALADLNSYLKDWYKMHDSQIWYNSHLMNERLGNHMGYFGYWAFEAAAVAFLLDLDDKKFHKYLYYPKDLVQWARSYKSQEDQAKVLNAPPSPPPLVGHPGQPVPKSGNWHTTALLEKRSLSLHAGDTFPEDQHDVSGNQVIWYLPSATPPQSLSQNALADSAPPTPPPPQEPQAPLPPPCRSGEICPQTGLWRPSVPMGSAFYAMVEANKHPRLVQKGEAMIAFGLPGNAEDHVIWHWTGPAPSRSVS